MNIYISHSSSYDYENEIYKPIKESELAAIHKFFLPHEPENIDVDAKHELKQTDVLVAEVSLPSTGQGIELGQARLSSTNFLCMASKPGGTVFHLLFEVNKVCSFYIYK